MEKIKEGVLSLDLFADYPVLRIHFDDKTKHQSYLGGICTLLMILIVILITVILAIPILRMDKPYNQVVHGILDDEEEILYN